MLSKLFAFFPQAFYESLAGNEPQDDATMPWWLVGYALMLGSSIAVLISAEWSICLLVKWLLVKPEPVKEKVRWTLEDFKCLCALIFIGFIVCGTFAISCAYCYTTGSYFIAYVWGICLVLQIISAIGGWLEKGWVVGDEVNYGP
jgi:hypothetical protein